MTAQIDPNKVLQRVVMPRAEDPADVRPMYLDDAGQAQVSSRRAVTVPKGAQVSFASYFNAFPASYWQRWTVVDDVVLRLSARGTGRVELYRSKLDGEIVQLDRTAVSSAEWTEVSFKINLASYTAGGWIWFDVATDSAALEIDNAAWTVEQALPAQTMAIGMTTMRPVDAVIALRTLGEDQTVLDVVRKVFVADQGAVKVRATEGFEDAARVLGDRLEVIEQDNLGGSGGFTRGLYEAIEHTDVDQIMLMDDDIRLEPEALLRSNAFARAATQPVVVGSHMLNLLHRARLHSTGEVVDLATCYWQAAPGAVTDHDFGASSLRDTAELHRRIDATYNGWWMCLFPRVVVERTGYPLPLFIKWDDAEYALRALDRGFPTVSLPGSAVWHMPWTDKNDDTNWQAYFQMRNRLVVAALHSPHDMRRTLLKQGLKVTLRHLLSMSYSTVAIQLKAVDDFLAGPGRLFDSLRTALPEIKALQQQYPDAQVLPSSGDLPATSDRALVKPVGKAALAAEVGKGLVHNLRRPEASAAARAQVNVPAADAHWYLLGNLDSVAVSYADGTGSFRRREPKEFRALMKRAVSTYRRLAQEWPRIQKAYGDAMPELTSVESWRKAFEN